MGLLFDTGSVKPGNVAEMRRENQRHRQRLEWLLVAGDQEDVVRELDRVVGALNMDKFSHQILFHAFLGGVGEAAVRVHDATANTPSPPHPVTPSPDQPVSEDDLRKALAAAEAELNAEASKNLELQRLKNSLPATDDGWTIVPEMELFCTATDGEEPWWCSVVAVGAEKITVRDHGRSEFTVSPAKLLFHAVEKENQNPEIPDPQSPSKEETTDERG